MIDGTVTTACAEIPQLVPLGPWIMGVTFPGVRPSIEKLALGQQCLTPGRDTLDGAVTRTEWTGCAGGSTVVLDTVVGLTHAWPRDQPVDATNSVLRFFGLLR